MKKEIRVLIVPPDRRPYTANIYTDLVWLQNVVGGYIEMIHPLNHDDDAVIICNEEGKILGLEVNRMLKDAEGMPYDILAGQFFICRAPEDSDDFESLTDEQVEKYTKMYA